MEALHRDIVIYLQIEKNYIQAEVKMRIISAHFMDRFLFSAIMKGKILSYCLTN